MSELNAAQQIALSRKQRILRGARDIGWGTAKFLMPHGIYKLGKKTKKRVKRLHNKYTTTKRLYLEAKARGLIPD